MSREDRIVRITQEKQNSTRTETFLFRGKPTILQVVRLPIETPVYRMDNGRTRLKQAEYFLHHNLSPDYFLKSEEDVTAQQIQHGLLLELSQDPRGPILEELRHRAAQTETLLTTASGVVVNGNRRLAAMRYLVVNGGEQFRDYNFVDLAILPAEATLEDIEEIESELQEIPETKLEYDWISRRLKLRYRRDVLHFKIDRLIRMYRFKNKEDVNRELQQLQLAEEYLEVYLKKPGEYELVEQSEEIIRQLQSALENKSPDMAELSKLIAFPLIKEARQLGSRAYEFRTAFGADLEEVLRRVAAQEKIEIQAIAPAAVSSKPQDNEDPLAGLAEKVDNRYVRVKPFLLDTARSQEIAAQIVRISNAIRQEKREGGRKLLALSNAQSANRSLHEIDLNGADPGTFPEVVAQLNSCISQAEKIRNRIAELQLRKQ